MENIFLSFLNISITAGWIVLAVVILRLLLKKAPKWISCLLWAVVGIRLVLPFSIESIFSLIPAKTTVDPNIVYQAEPTVNTGIDAVNSMVNPIITSSFAPNPGDSANPLQIWTFIAAWVWVIGIGLMLLYTLISYIALRVKVRAAVKHEGNIYQSERVSSPFILGIIRPRIYLPFKISKEDIDHVVAHERAHLKRCDHLIKPIAFVLLSVYWFNPLMWVAYILLCRDIELACDEKVIGRMEHTEKQEYSKALLDLSVRRISVAGCPLAFGEVGVKARIKSVMNYKKPAFWIIIAALIICIVVSVCFLTDPVDNNIKLYELEDGRVFINIYDNIDHIEINDDALIYLSANDTQVELIKNRLFEIEISASEISQSRSEDRDKIRRIYLHYNQDGTSITSIYFNADCTQLWIDDGVKPTYTYRVIDPEAAIDIFEGNYLPRVTEAEGPISYDDIENIILEHNKDAYLKGDVGVCTYRELLTEGKDGKMYIYLMALYGEYVQDPDTGDIEMVSGGASPVRLTFELENGEYICTEYYSKEKGFEADFPEAALTALDSVDMDEMWAELDNKASQRLTSVSYHYSDPDNSLKFASVTLWGKENFQFTYSMLSSNLCMGKYTSEGNKLILREDGCDNVYTFIVNNRDIGTIIFDAENSSPLPKYKYGTNAQPEVCLPDGAEFKTAFEIDATIDAVMDLTPIEGVEYSLKINESSVTDNSIYVPAGDVVVSLTERISNDVAYKRVEGNYLSTPINEAIVDIDYPFEEDGRDGTTVTSYECHLKKVPVGRIIHITVTKELQKRLGLGDNVIEMIAVAPSAVVESDMYTVDDIASAVATVEQVMALNWPGCTLKEIYYAGDEKSQKHQDWADRNDADEVIVLLSSFDVDESCPIGSLDKNRTYLGWNWILVRNKGGQWQHVDHGY